MTRSLKSLAPWIGLAILFAVLPKIFGSGSSITTLSIMGVMIIFALSYNMLLGQTGLLSFGHAVYYGLAGYVTIHAMNAVISNKYPVPLPLLPLVGGFAGLFFGVLFGSISTRRAGTVFSMISLGLGELVAASALALHAFFGGESGVTVNRAKLMPFFGYKFGPQIEVYYLIAVWCFIAIAGMYAITRTPFGRICNAVRENAERAQFIGYDAQRVRFIAFSLSAFFAGIAGALAAINFEIVNFQSVGAQESGLVLLMTFFGGAGTFIGPMIGAVAITFLQLTLSDVTPASMLYFGLLFIFIVMFSPTGVAGWLMLHMPALRSGQIGKLLPSYALVIVPGAIAFLGAITLVELTAHMLVTARSQGPVLRLFSIDLDGSKPVTWVVALAVCAGGIFLTHLAWRRIGMAWATIDLPAKNDLQVKRKVAA